jgi:hypothetical protein
LNEVISALVSKPLLGDSSKEDVTLVNSLVEDAGRVGHKAFFEGSQTELFEFHRTLFELFELHIAPPGSPQCDYQFDPALTRLRAVMERDWLHAEAKRSTIRSIPNTGEGLVRALKEMWSLHRVTSHPIFDFLEKDASRQQVVEFFRSDSALNIRFFDLIVLSLLGSQDEARKELSQNFWDEAGRGDPRRGHVRLFRDLLQKVGVHPDTDNSVLEWQGLAGYNLFMLCCLNRKHYFKSLGVMAMTELLDPAQYEKLTRGCRRVGMGAHGELDYYEEHISIDVVHGEGWLTNVIQPAVAQTPQAIPEILTGAELRLATCADYYDALYARLQLVV